jgi:succinate dehydrogenase / fumarate reductase cytochrome b subunit
MSTNNLGVTLEQSVKYQGRWGQWAWIFHRLSGLGVLLFLTIHIADTSMVYFYPPLYEEALKLYKSVPFGVGELLLAAALIYHGLNGIRVALVDFEPSLTRYQRQMWAIVWALFVIGYGVTLAIMGPELLHLVGLL